VDPWIEPTIRILLTGARAPVTLELIRLFARAGHQVFVAESARVHLGQASRFVTRAFVIPKPRLEPERFIQALERIVKLEQIDLVIPTCEEIFWISGQIASSSLRQKFFVSGPETLLELHDKSRFAALTQRLGLRFPKTQILKSKSDLERLARNQKQILKPAFSRFAAKTQVFEIGAKPPNIFPNTNQTWLAQTFLEGPELCSYAVVRAGRVQAFVLYRPVWRAGFGASVMFESFAPDDPTSLEALRMTRSVVEHLNFSGQIAFDFIQSNDGLNLLECNPRATSGVHLFTADERLERAFLETLETPIVPLATRRAMLALPMVLYGLPKAIRAGTVRQWLQDFRSSRDVIFDPEDARPAWHQIPCTIELLRQAQRLGCSPLEASTADIEWNGEVFAAEMPTPKIRIFESVDDLERSQIPATPATKVLVEWMRRSSSGLVKNVKTELIALQVADTILPLSVNAGESGNSYVVSPFSHYVTYAKEELRELNNPRLEGFLRLALDGLGALLRWGEVDQIVQVNNAFVSTNLHPQFSFTELQTITKTLEIRFPDRAIVFRSVHDYAASRLPEFLLGCGYRLIPARSVLFVDAAVGDFRRKTDFKRDQKLLAESGYQIRKLEQPSTVELERVCELYGLLYLHKYSFQNPQFTPVFLELGIRTGWLEVFVLERDGRIDGALGFYRSDDALTTPMVGYDTALPLETGLYRMLMAFLLLEAQRRGLQLHASSGVAKFKRSRGASSAIEYMAVYTKHLPWRRRLVWALLELLMRFVAVPLIAGSEL
jgi:glutathione synthase/RimK-type ligase-like ATP-grasp enzyme